MDAATLQEAVARAREKIAAQQAKKAAQAGANVKLDMVAAEAQSQPVNGSPYTSATNVSHGNLRWNEQQLAAIELGLQGKSFCLIGAAGTGKTTTLRGMLKELMAQDKCPPLERGTKNLTTGSPGIVLVSYTRRAVRNVIKQMPEELKAHCLTIHKLIEFEPEPFEKEVYDDKGIFVGMKTSMRFAPQRTRINPLPRNLRTIVIDEASMVSIELFTQLLEALPNHNNVQFIVLGDLNQLPPIYGQAILGKMLLERPIVELTKVYRQALESPIISLALAVKNNDFSQMQEDIAKRVFAVNGSTVNFDTKVNVAELREKVTLERAGRGKVTLHPWKKQLDQEDGLAAIKGQFNAWIASGEYLPDEDLILCPWNKSFGTEEINKSIANKLGKLRNADVYEIIAGYEKHYWAVGDKLMVDKQEAIILAIERNFKYAGKRPSPHSPYLDRWGSCQKAVTDQDADLDMSDEDIDKLLENMGMVDDRTHEASHTVTVRLLDTGEEVKISKSAEINASTFGYAISVHKAQGSECRKVFFITHACHSKMLFRELVYTAITRASEELYIICSPQMLKTAAARPRIKGDTLQAKLAWYQEKFNERIE